MSLACYPFFSNYLISQNHDSEIGSQQVAVEKMEEVDIENVLKNAEIYNKSLLGNVVLTDPFDPGFEAETDIDYEYQLNINNDSMMANIEIPILSIKLPIYHGTSQNTLLKGIGHLQKTSLPIGGKGTHAVLTGHTGLSIASMFTDIDKLKLDDVFYIHVLNKTLAYKVDQIKVVKPSQTEDLRIDTDEDYVTLVTCTPYGVNTHRLLVRGTRIPYEEAEQLLEGATPVESTWMVEYRNALIAGAVALVLVITAFIIIKTIRSKRRNNSELESEE
ncbi:MAG: class C sortase [Ruminococcus sp.]|nr:class C sortase [Ruminococcus sp.]